MKKLLVRSMMLSIGGGLALALVNLLMPSVLPPIVGLLIGGILFSKVYLASGRITWQRDLLLAMTVGCLSVTLYLAMISSCALLRGLLMHCRGKYPETIFYVDLGFVMLPIVLFWSWIRFRWLRYSLSKHDKEQVLHF